MLLKIANTIVANTSILAVHFTGNTGLNERTEDQLVSLFKATWEPPINKQTFKGLLGHKEELNPRECLRQQQINEERLALAPSASDVPRRHLIFTRILGYELEIPGSEHWHLYQDSARECWICDRRLLSIVLWSPEFGSAETTAMQISQPD